MPNTPKSDRTNEQKQVIEHIPVADLTPNPRNSRTHSERQISKLTALIREFGFIGAIPVNGERVILAGNACFEAARRLGYEQLPCIRVAHLTKKQERLFAIADNRIAELSTWDEAALAEELKALSEICLDLEIQLTGFETAEIDILIEAPERQHQPDPADQLPAIDLERPSISRPGDLFNLGSHRLICGDAQQAKTFEALLGRDRAQMVITDPPYNVSINGHVSGLGSIKHEEFMMASGEMSPQQFRAFLKTTLSLAAMLSDDGSIHLIFMDWRNLADLLQVGLEIYSEQKNLCVWNKTNGGMGSFYRSKHELVAVFKHGTAPHINNIELGRYGRYRTNVWDYPGANTFKRGRDQELAMHPTVKPVALVADAIRDCSHRRGLILDPFCGSGTIFIAAEKTGRRAAAIELDARYVDTAVLRWQEFTGRTASHASTGLSFAELEIQRSSGDPSPIILAEHEDQEDAR